MMRRLSIRVRLTAWYSAFLALTFLLLGVGTYFALHDAIDDTVDKQLRDRLKAIPESIQRGLPAAEPLRICRPDHTVLYQSPVMQYPLGPCAARSLPQRGLVETRRFSDQPMRVLSANVAVQGAAYLVQVAAPLGEFYEMLEDFEWTLLWASPVLLFLASAGGYWMSRRALAPVDRIITKAQGMGAGNLSERLDVPPTGDELARLSDTLNALFARLESAFRRITQFTADASHELRTPVAVIRTTAELALQKARPEADYREALAQILCESEHTSRLIEDLMMLARADSGATTLQVGPTDLTVAVRQACEQGSLLAEARQLAFEATLAQTPLVVRGDPRALRRMALIFIDNAAKYTPRGGCIAVSVRAEGDFAIAEVRDSGIGISAQDLPHIFERFYRADKARARDAGGAGLGLSIAQWIAEAHGTRIEVESAAGKGTTFRVRLKIFRDS